MRSSAALVWFRRDLRDDDHAALAAALAAHEQVHCVFVFDSAILGQLAPDNRRVGFLHASVVELGDALAARGGALRILRGSAEEEIPKLAHVLGVAAVYANRDYEPAAIRRDAAVAEALAACGIDWRTRKDQVVFELDEVRTRGGTAFSVFTPYKRAWLEKLAPEDHASRDTRVHPGRLAPAEPAQAVVPTLAELGFKPADCAIEPGMAAGARRLSAFVPRLRDYAARRDFPAIDGTSGLSAHLRFGTVSIRALVRLALATPGEGSAAWLSELVWRDFYQAILAWRPHVVTCAFKPQFDALVWEPDADGVYYRAWCEGRTGYPLVDVAMRELAASGLMHNRLRMLVASFLVKHLGLDWRRGEAWFAAQLLDHDLAANNGGWQWSASTGCDAQPWFRIFNPVTQSRKFDPEGVYMRRWLPELARVPAALIHEPWRMAPLEQQAAGCVAGRDYPSPVVNHDEARRCTLARYGALKGEGRTVAPLK